jgi:hypothetical protein
MGHPRGAASKWRPLPTGRVPDRENRDAVALDFEVHEVTRAREQQSSQFRRRTLVAASPREDGGATKGASAGRPLLCGGLELRDRGGRRESLSQSQDLARLEGRGFPPPGTLAKCRSSAQAHSSGASSAGACGTSAVVQ